MNDQGIVAIDSAGVGWGLRLFEHSNGKMSKRRILNSILSVNHVEIWNAHKEGESI